MGQCYIQQNWYKYVLNTVKIDYFIHIDPFSLQKYQTWTKTNSLNTYIHKKKENTGVRHHGWDVFLHYYTKQNNTKLPWNSIQKITPRTKRHHYNLGSVRLTSTHQTSKPHSRLHKAHLQSCNSVKSQNHNQSAKPAGFIIL